MGGTNSLGATNESRFVCKSCARSFRRVEHLRRHETTHTGTRSHVCPNCSSTFFRGDVLVRHMRNVHRAIVSGVKELRMANRSTSNSRSLTAAGTFASNGMPHINPNPQASAELGLHNIGQLPRYDEISAESFIKNGNVYPKSLPQSANGASMGLPWGHVQHHFQRPPEGPAPPPLQQQLFPAYSPSPMRMLRLYIRQPLENGMPISATNEILSTANPPMENLIAYGYGPYAPNVPGWTDTAVSMSSSIPASSKHIAEQVELAEQASQRRSSSHSGLSSGRVQKSGYRKDSQSSIDATALSSASDSDQETSVPSFENRDHYLDFIPVHRTSVSGSDYDGSAHSQSQRGHRNSVGSDLGTTRQHRHSKGDAREQAPVAEMPQAEQNRQDHFRVDDDRDSKEGASAALTGHTPISEGALSESSEPAALKTFSSPGSLSSPASIGSPNGAATSPNSIDESYKPSSAKLDKIGPHPLVKTTSRDLSHIIRFLEMPPGVELLSPTVFERYISYFNNYSHPIMPVIHKPTFDLKNVKPALLFAICALSANVLQEESTAKVLQANSLRILFKDWEAFASLGQEKMEDVDEWTYFLHTSLVLVWHSYAFASSPKTLNIAFKMRSFQDKLIRAFPGLPQTGSASSGMSYRDWIRQQQVVRGFSTLFSLEYVAVCSYGLEPRTHNILNACCHLPLPSGEQIWNSHFKSEPYWRINCIREEVDIARNPRTFDDLLTPLKSLDISEFKKIVPLWKLSPVSLIAFSTFVFIECEVKWGRTGSALPKEYYDIWSLVSSRIQEADLHSNPDNSDSLGSLYQYGHEGPFKDRNTYKYQLVPTWQRIWQSQHPLVALCSMVVESSRCGLSVNVNEIKSRVREFDVQGIANSLLRAMYENKHKDLSVYLPVVGIIVDFVRFSLVSGSHGTMRFNTLYSASFTRTVSVLLGHRSLTFFCCWIFAIELRLRSGQPVNKQELEVFRIVEKSCADYETQEHWSPNQEQKSANEANTSQEDAEGSKGSVKLRVTASITSLLGTFTDDVNDGVPIEPYYYALQSIGAYLGKTEIPLSKV